ncbi:hypothetical protein OX459_27310 [Janthinobacterium sp. SUN026]|uniref:ATP-grasp domain-containing protein n=1 Tax=Janthinobacterium sp. SUN026 TaxID=3002438 RepID=UPI0025B21F1E|nr:hypothetical protein [Janthinobacterium sp. SUN026]MDN2675114.1 hypothetical protein [Janthinobacterium sp. SUN026]
MKSLNLVGLDLLLDDSGVWHFLEINENPIGLAFAETLFEDYFHKEFKSPIKEICDVLCQNDALRIGLVLPYKFSVKNSVDEDDFSFSNIGSEITHSTLGIIDDFRRIKSELELRGKKCYVLDKNSVFERNGNIISLWGEKLDSVLNRCGIFHWSQYAGKTRIVNDVRARLVCKNKFLAQKIFFSMGNASKHPSYYSFNQTVFFENSEKTVSFLSKLSDQDSWIVKKPNWGGGSNGVTRLSAKEALMQVLKLPFTLSYQTDFMQAAAPNSWILEEWYPSKPAYKNSNRYQFDVRAILINGNFVLCHARRALAPSKFLESMPDAEASWLTPLGSGLPIFSECNADHDGVILTNEELQGCIAFSESIVKNLERWCGTITCKDMLSFLPQPGKLYGKLSQGIEINVQNNLPG